MSTWVTITEAVEITTKAIKQKITPSDIYRHALSGNILLSVYFQSPVILKKIQTFNGKIKFRQFVGDLLDKLCMLDRDGFIYGQNLRLCTEARYICPVQQIIDTPLLRKLNQFRTFVRNVRPGDELDVPAQVSEKNLTPPPGNSSGNLEQQIASTSQLIGSLLAEDMNSEQAANIARGWASSQASGVMTDWLSRFGTARITLGVDEDFSLKDPVTATLENGDSMQQTVNYVPNVTNAEITLAASKDPVIADNNDLTTLTAPSLIQRAMR